LLTKLPYQLLLNREKERHVPVQQTEGNCSAPEVPSKSKSLKIYICKQAIKNYCQIPHAHFTKQNKKHLKITALLSSQPL
jgi:hypothetical protein